MTTCRGVSPLTVHIAVASEESLAARLAGGAVANRIADFDLDRSRFLSELSEAQPDLQGYQDYLKYWRAVESEAQESEDLDKIDTWVRDLARDKDKVAALKQRASTVGENEAMRSTIAQILKVVLEALETIERRLRKLRDQKMAALAAVLWKGGPGTMLKKKEDEKDKKDGKKKEDTAKEAAAVPIQQPPKLDPAKKDKEKKMER